MNKLVRVFVVIALIILAIFFIRVVTSQDDSPSTTTEDHREALADWNEAGQEAQNVVCVMWNVSEDSVRELLNDTNTDQGVIEAKMVLIKSECE